MSELEHVGHRDHMRTVSGVLFNLIAPTPNMVVWRDIAHSLAMLPRYGGHTPYPYPVAQHCIIAARMARADGRSNEEIAAVLLHDAAEPYIGDIISPVKRWFYPVLSPREDRILSVVFAKAGLAAPENYARVIEHYDAQLFLDEVNFFFPSSSDDTTWRLPEVSPETGRRMSIRTRSFRRYGHHGLCEAFMRELEQLGIVGDHHYAESRKTAGIEDEYAFERVLRSCLHGIECSVVVMNAEHEAYLLIGYRNSEDRSRVCGIVEELCDDLGGEPYPVKLRLVSEL